jgi:hypothetical protein
MLSASSISAARQHEEPARVPREGAVQEQVVHLATGADDRRDRLRGRQVEERRHVAALQVQVHDGGVRPASAHEAAGQVHGERRRPEAAARAVDREDAAADAAAGGIPTSSGGT